LAYAPNSQPRIPTRVCQGRVVTTDLPTLGTDPNSIQHGSTTQKAKDIGNLEVPGRLSAVSGRTVREEGADCPRGGHIPSENATRTSSTAPKQIVCDGPPDHPPRDGPSDTLVWTVRKLHAPKIHRQKGSKERRSRTRTDTKNSRAVRNLPDGPR
jgi:hypothetical protein